jgi:hypothetical protein
MSNTHLKLGPVAFQNFEIPSKINFGGQQRVIVHTLADGSRVTDVLGPSDSDLQFSGVMSGTDATERAILLDKLRVAGDALSLTWDVFFYSVILNRLTIEFQSEFWIPFSISCTIINQTVAQTSSLSETQVCAISNDLQALSSVGTIDGINWETAEKCAEQQRSCYLGSEENREATSAAANIVAEIGQMCVGADAILGHLALNDLENACAQLVYAGNTTFNIWQLTVADGIWGRIYRNLLNSST